MPPRFKAIKIPTKTPKTEGRFEGAGRRGGAAIDSGLNKAGYSAKRGVASVKKAVIASAQAGQNAANKVTIATGRAVKNAANATGRAVINAGKEVANKTKMAGAYAKKKERSAAYQVGKLITGQTKNQNANRRAGRIGYAGIAATGTAIGSLGAHAVNSSWSEHKKSQRGY